MVGKTDLESMLDESGFSADTEMGAFAMDKGSEVYLAPEPFLDIHLHFIRISQSSF